MNLQDSADVCCHISQAFLTIAIDLLNLRAFHIQTVQLQELGLPAEILNTLLY